MRVMRPSWRRLLNIRTCSRNAKPTTKPSTNVSTLRTPWPWQKYCLNHCARTCYSLRIVTRCRFTNWPIGCERGGRNVHFLCINLISFRRSCGIVLVMASPVREMDSASRQWNTEKDARNVRAFSVKRLPSGGTRSCMPQQTRYAGVCADWEQKLLRCFQVGLIRTVIDHVTVSERASWYSVCDWPDSYRQSTLFGIGLKSAPTPGDGYGAS